MGSTKTVENKQVQTNDPPSWAAPGLAELGSRITSIIPTVPGEKYTGDFVAQPGAAAMAAPGAYQSAGSVLQSLIAPAMAASAAAMTPVSLPALPSFAAPSFSAPSYDGPSIDAGTQGFGSYDASSIQPVVSAAIQPLMRQLTEQVLPSIRSSAQESGAYSGSRAQTTLPAMAIRDTGRQAQEVATQLAYTDFARQQQAQQQAYQLATQRGATTGQLTNEQQIAAMNAETQRGEILGSLGLQGASLDAQTLTSRLGLMPDLLDTIARMSTGSADATAMAGQLEAANAQAGINNQLQKFDYGVRYPFQGLDVAAALLGNLAQPWGTSTLNGTQTTTTGGLGNVVGGLIGLGSMVGSFPGIGGLFKKGA